jgi:polar amino acid transport system substrate-binding protein
MNRKFASLITSGWLLLGFASTARAESTLDKIQRTGVLKVAIRQDAAPFGYLDANDNLQGYCLDFFAILEKQLLEKLNRNSLSVKLYKSTLNNRFELVSRGIVDLECGPNTIRSNLPEVNFSTGFFQTGTQFLVKENNRIDLDGDLSNSRLGVIDNTSTAEFVAQRYPLATLRKYSGVTARTRGVEAVEQGRIDAMISDGILLRAEAQQQELSSARYPLIPDLPLTCDRYGMIIPVEDPQWQNFVDSVINSSQIEALSTAWFGQLANYTQSAVESCN